MGTWIAKNEYLTGDEMKNNALLVWSFFEPKGWTQNAVAAMLGNMQTESNINPGLWESLVPYGGGYGLVQWTPYTNYSRWAGSGWQNNGTKQCERIEYERKNKKQWIATAQFPLSFDEFAKSHADPAVLAYAFLYNYERPASLDQPQRQEQAKMWYDYLDGKPIDPDVPGGGGRPGGRLPIWLLFKLRRIY